jgi:nucleotide-binding universal stress UspA family protein
MDRPIVLCTDGSALALEALRSGLALLADPGDVVVTTVIEPSDLSLVTGTGFAGGTMSATELDDLDRTRHNEARNLLDDTIAALGLHGAEARVIDGNPGPTVCELAAELEARAVVVGSRGRGGFKRAILGSVSDHIVRNAPCPVIVVGGTALDEEPG